MQYLTGTTRGVKTTGKKITQTCLGTEEQESSDIVQTITNIKSVESKKSN